MRIALKIAYDGTHLKGWQRNPALRTVQGELEEALARIGHPGVTVASASRTDAGVHARGQVVQVNVPDRTELGALARALTGTLPEDILLVAAAPGPRRFNARWSARGKIYTYLASEGGPAGDPFLAGYTWSLPDDRAVAVAPDARLDVERMRQALTGLLGVLDVRGLATHRGPWKRGGRHARRLGLGRLEVLSGPGDARVIAVTVTGDAFLKHQVRNLVGLLVQVGYGELEPDALPTLVAGRRRHEGPRAPGRGLSLVRVCYPRAVDPFARENRPLFF